MRRLNLLPVRGVKLHAPSHLLITGEIAVVLIDAVARFHIVEWVIVIVVTLLVHHPAVGSALSSLAEKVSTED